MKASSVVFYRGPSVLTGDPIMAVVSGLSALSANPKTGPMLQTWILRADMTPSAAVASGDDEAICGKCPLRGSLEARTHHMIATHQAPSMKFGRACYVPYWRGPNNVFKSVERGTTLELTPAQLAPLLADRFVRIGSYGDPAAVPFEVWDQALSRIGLAWVGYTHQWKTCDPRLRDLLMASVESDAGAAEAQAAGWRTFRARQGSMLHPERGLRENEVICPASEEAGHRTSCQECGLCRGHASSSSKSIAILAHGRFAAAVPA